MHFVFSVALHLIYALHILMLPNNVPLTPMLWFCHRPTVLCCARAAQLSTNLNVARAQKQL